MNFDEKSVTWDNEKRMNRAKIVAEEISKAVSITKANTAMEFGCGTGQVSFNLQDKFKKIVLVDTSKGMIEILNSKIQENGIKNMMGIMVLIKILL